jgi:diadenylate cyclase
MLSKKLIEYSCHLAAQINADAVLIYADATSALIGIEKILEQFPLKFIVALRADESFPRSVSPDLTFVRVPNVPMTRLEQVKVALLVSLARGILKKGDQVVLMTGIERSQVIDTIMVLNLETESELISVVEPLILSPGIQPEVFERVLTVAAQIAFEGREGRQVGTIFVVGDEQEVLKLTQNLILNPFYGYPQEKRNILDINLEETIKEFATIDGAFVIAGNGIVETAGARLLASVVPHDLSHGLGTRHASAAAITNLTKSVSISISQSTGTISIFRAGRIVAQLPRPTPKLRFAL